MSQRGQPGRPSKYHNRPTVFNGVRYASRAEARRAAQLDYLYHAGAILAWSRQPLYRLGCHENVYIADFEVEALVQSGSAGVCRRVWAEDVKGRETAKFRRDKKLWKRYGPHELRILRPAGRDGEWEVENVAGGMQAGGR